ncbi:hypothetical protein TNIN_103251 [Trichonephila inaurata madagascariensis]|uniref:Uncharacterized protein n=1 Tax=Trichonephila inaurata madagascariensis TaxID=2747483 RepID=A0A8X6JKK6_9ARAC|nr:hypothetical protein TNIN_103251 [Trichonephila inaurata madagascariensis]
MYNQTTRPISHMSLLAYEKPIIPGYSQILHDDQALTEKNFNGVDFLWLYGKWKIISSFSGMAFSNSSLKIIRIFLLLGLFLSFMDHPASNVDTIYATLHCATNIAKLHGQKKCLITFDQPLCSEVSTLKSLLL